MISRIPSRLSVLDLTWLTDRLAGLVPFLEGRTILLTGGTGLFGKWLLESYVALRLAHPFSGEVRILSRNPESFLARNPYFAQFPFLKFFSGDVRTASIPSAPVDFVIHAATEASAKLEKEQPDEMFSVIVDGTRHILKLARRDGALRFLFVSSGAVYGPQPPDLPNIPEDFPCAPVTFYGRGKFQAEQMVLEAASRTGMAVVIPRCFAFVGPYLNLGIHFAAGNFLRNALDREPILIRGDGTPFRSYLYAAELAVWLWTLLLKAPTQSIFNVGSPEPISILELARAVSALLPEPLPIEVLQKAEPNVLPPRYVPSVERIASELGLVPEISLSEALRKTLAFHQRPIPQAKD